MEDISNNKVLCINNESNIIRKRTAILSLLKRGIDIIVFFDTETTGLNIYPSRESGVLRDRIIEVGFVMCFQDRDGEIKSVMLDGIPITFQEYVNPFKEPASLREKHSSVNFTAKEALNIHKITNNFLFGRESFNGLTLKNGAPTFAEMKPLMESFLCLDELANMDGTMHFVGHNCKKFDAPMLTEEMYLVDQYKKGTTLKKTFESIVPSIIDTFTIMQDLFDKQDLIDKRGDSLLRPKYSMSYLAHMLNVKEEGREFFHGALLDAMILKNVFSKLIKTQEWLLAKNSIEIKKQGVRSKILSVKPLPSFSNTFSFSENVQSDILTVIKTDASFSEGTGVIAEYVEAAKLNGIDSLVLSDVVSVSRFVEFYESCEKENIKPIIGATFKIESKNDIYNHIKKNQIASDQIFNAILIIMDECSDIKFNSLLDFISHYNIDVVQFDLIAQSMVTLNKKRYSPRKTGKELVVRDVLDFTNIEYKKGIVSGGAMSELVDIIDYNKNSDPLLPIGVNGGVMHNKAAVAHILKIVSVIMKVSSDLEFDSLQSFISHYNIDVVQFEKSILKVAMMNNKMDASNEKLEEKIVRDLLAVTDIKYKKGILSNTTMSELGLFVLRNEKLIKYNVFSRIDGHSNILLLADNNAGFQTIKMLISDAYKDGQYFVKQGMGLKKGEHPLLTMDMLENNHENITAIVGNKDDILGRAVSCGDVKRSQNVINELKKIFKTKLKGQICITEQSKKEINFMNNIMNVCAAQEIDIIASQYALFAKKEDYKIHLNKFAILLDKSISSVTLNAGDVEFSYVHSKKDMIELYSNNKKLLENTSKFLNEFSLSPILHHPKLPKFKTSNGKSQDAELYDFAVSGLKKRLPIAYEFYMESGEQSKEKDSYNLFCKRYKQRLDYEIGIINQMEFSGYFLIKKQMIDFCKREGIPVGAGRGSAAGSLVVYSLGITDADPIAHGLIFERFLNPSRKEMPDIDTDIDGEYRERVLNFLCEEYKKEGIGYSGAAYIMTKGTFSAKNTLKTLAKSEGMSLRWADELSKTISNGPGISLSSEIENNEELKERYNSEAKTKQIIDNAIQLEKNGGRQISTGKHAGGIVVGSLILQAPITLIKGIPVVQADKKDIETLGAVKFDLLGLGTLAKLHLALQNIERNKGIKALHDIGIIKEDKIYNFNSFRYDDKETFEMLKIANTTNVFQIESDLFKNLIKKMKPDNLAEIVALVSLGRPGPIESGMDVTFVKNKFDPSKRELYHPLIDHLLDETHGTIIYQEQVMAIAQKLSNFTLGDADKLRSAMSKKKIDQIKKIKLQFMSGAKSNNVPEEVADNIYSTIEKFAGYGFNKSHALAYALLTYKMAYLRKNHPTETMAAIMSKDTQGTESSATITKDLGSCKDVGLIVQAPQLNNSVRDFKAGKTNCILYGFSGIKGFTFDKLLDERDKNGSFKNMEDYIIRCGLTKSLTALIEVGAMDHIHLMVPISNNIKEGIQNVGKTEKTIIKRILIDTERDFFSTLLGTVAKRKKYIQGSFDADRLSNAYECSFSNFTKHKLKLLSAFLSKEAELLGGYITAHPLDLGNTRDNIKNNTTLEQIQLGKIDDDEFIGIREKYNVAGIIVEIRDNITSKAGNKLVAIELSDESSSKSFIMKKSNFEELNSKIKMKGAKQLSEGDILGMDISYYESQGLKPSIDSIYVNSCNITVSLKQNKVKKQYRNYSN